MHRLFRLLLLAPLLFATACSTPAPPSAGDAASPPMPGSDRDAHGCIGSAGYAWCAHTQQCERPWELAASAGFEHSAAGFDAYCAVPAAPASDD
jgi:hypothetical protein